jgi:hypothetical protein
METPSTAFAEQMILFLRTVSRVEGLADTLVRGAVRDVLLRVSRDYGIDYAYLLNSYEESIVDEHAHLPTKYQQCKAPLEKRSKNKVCSSMATHGDYCARHKHLGLTKDVKKKRLQAYSQRETHQPPAITQLLTILKVPTKSHTTILIPQSKKNVSSSIM